MRRMPEVPACAGDGGGGGVSTGPDWPCLALVTPTREAENEATAVSFGTPSTRTRWASRPWWWPWLALVTDPGVGLGVGRSGETFNSVAFGCISSHFPNPLLTLQRARGSDRLRGNDGCEQCSSQRGYGVRGSCRWFVVGVHPFGDLCVTAPGGRSSSHPPARYACGGHPHAPGSGASPLCTPPFEGLRGPPL